MDGEFSVCSRHVTTCTECTCHFMMSGLEIPSSQIQHTFPDTLLMNERTCLYPAKDKCLSLFKNKFLCQVHLLTQIDALDLRM